MESPIWRSLFGMRQHVSTLSNGEALPTDLDLVIRELPSQTFTFMLNNLMSSTTYYYSINDGLIYDFTTSSGSNDTYTFAVGSDAHFGRIVSNTTATVRMLLKSSIPHGLTMPSSFWVI